MLQTDWGRKTTIKRTAEKSLKPIPNRPPAGRPSENMDDFRQENAPTCVHRCPLTKPPSSPRDENSTLVTKSKSGMSDKSDPEGTLPRPLDEKHIFVKKGTTSEQTLSDPVAGRRANCRGRRFQFSSRDFPKGDSFPDPLHVAVNFTYLEFSYRTIPLRRIRLACRLIAGAKFGRNFRQETRRSVMSVPSQAKKTERFSVR